VDSGFRLVHLTRRDLVAQAASVLHAEMHRHHYRDGDGEHFAPFTVEVAAFIAALHILDQNARALDDALAGLDALSLTYEDDLATDAAQQLAAARVCAILGVRAAPVSTTLRRLAPVSTADRLANWDEVASAVRLTRFADLVHEG
jgi:LPS sulfotransferase NodH